MRIDDLRERLKDDNEVFTASEVRELIDWELMQGLKNSYQQARVAAVMQEQKRLTDESLAIQREFEERRLANEMSMGATLRRVDEYGQAV